MDKEEKLKSIINRLRSLEGELFKLEFGYEVYRNHRHEIKDIIDNIINRINLIDVQLISGSEEKYLDGIHNKMDEVGGILTDMKSYDLKPSNHLNLIENYLVKIKRLLNEVYKEVRDELPVISLEKAKKSINDIISGFRDEIKQNKKEYNTLTKKILEYDELLTEKTSAYDTLTKKTLEYDKLLIEKISEYDDLVKKIEKIMPGAISAGLGEDFSKQRERLETQIDNWSMWFIVAIVLLMLFAGWGIWDAKKVNNIADYSYNLLPKIPMLTALVWLVSYVSKRRSEYNRLAQEYAHKEVVAKSYGSCKKQTEGADPKLLESLLKNTIESIAYNPSGTLDRKHGDKMPVQELLKKLYEICKKLKKGE